MTTEVKSDFTQFGQDMQSWIGRFEGSQDIPQKAVARILKTNNDATFNAKLQNAVGESIKPIG